MSDAAAPAAAPAPKSPAKPKAKKPAAKKGPGAGKYQTMIVAAITALKDRTGSSVPAINKYIGANFKKDLSTGWEKTVAQVLKRFAASGKVVKVKASYKVRGAAPWCALAAAPWPVCTACLVAHTCCTFLAMSRCAAGSRQQLVGPLVQVVGRYICVWSPKHATTYHTQAAQKHKWWQTYESLCHLQVAAPGFLPEDHPWREPFPRVSQLGEALKKKPAAKKPAAKKPAAKKAAGEGAAKKVVKKKPAAKKPKASGDKKVTKPKAAKAAAKPKAAKAAAKPKTPAKKKAAAPKVKKTPTKKAAAKPKKAPAAKKAAKPAAKKAAPKKAKKATPKKA
jgi:hypothetical protein